MRRLIIAALALFLYGPLAHAELPPAEVEYVQPSAWLERNNRARPISVGTQLQSGDRIRTGSRGRLRIAMVDGSHLKIGSDARLTADELFANEEDEGFLRGALNVVQGAFRYTSGAVERLVGGREIDVRVGSVTAGIRGTDIWGAATEDRDFVVLLSGRIEVGSRGRRAELDQPATAYIQPRDDEAQVAVPIDGDTIAEFAAQTEPLPGEAGISADGEWSLHLESARDTEAAARMLERYHGDGYPARIAAVQVDGRAWHRISIHGIDALGGARALAARLEAHYGIAGTWAERTGRMGD